MLPIAGKVVWLLRKRRSRSIVVCLQRGTAVHVGPVGTVQMPGQVPGQVGRPEPGAASDRAGPRRPSREGPPAVPRFSPRQSIPAQTVPAVPRAVPGADAGAHPRVHGRFPLSNVRPGNRS